MTKNVLVTGGAGFIGSHTCKALAASGYRPVTYDSLALGHRDAVRWGPFEEGDILDGPRLAEAFRRHRPVAVVHFAARSNVGESTRNPLKYYRHNVSGTISLVETALEFGVRDIVFSSTCATYGEPDTVPIAEDAAQRPVSVYGRSKLMVEDVLRDACAQHDFSVVSLRYFNAAGASLDGEIGEDHDPETHLIPLVLRAAQDPSRSIRVFGTDYPTADGTCVRDYIHVMDLASAHVRALDGLLSGAMRGRFTGLNLGTGQGYSVRAIIEEARRITGCPITVEEAPRREGDAAELVANAAAAERALGWRAEMSDLDTIITTAWRYMELQRQAALEPAEPLEGLRAAS